MTAIPKQQDLLTVAEYLAAEDARSERHDYLGGYVYPVVENTSIDHNVIQLNLFRKIDPAIAKPCRALTSDVKVQLQTDEGDDYFYYPDLLVKCDPEDNNNRFVQSPKFIAEVMSPSTERVDVREKWFAYRYNPAVEEILLLKQDKVGGRITRKVNEKWEIEILEDDSSTLRLVSLGIEFPLVDLYADVSWRES